MRPRLVVLIAACAATASIASAQVPGDSLRPGATVTVTPGAHYQAGGLHRALFGAHYRDLWATPIKVEVLDLRSYAGGLRPTRRGGGKQTKTLRFESADGRKWAFRSLDKDPSPLLPADLRETLVDRVFQDQISASLPGGALVVPPLLEAAGVTSAPPGLYVMPDDPVLGEYRADFAGLLGTLEERPSALSDDAPGFDSARKVADTEELLDKLDRTPRERIDTLTFLKARLLDVFLGDWDRHAGQWRWIKVGEDREAPWEPVPYDRDQAFVRYDGLLLDLARTGYPQLVNFSDAYPSAIGITWNARFLDRRLLVGLERPVWDSLAHELQRRLTDAVIDDAVRRLPPEVYAKGGARLASALKRRRDRLPEEAGRIYQLLAGDVDVRATDKTEVVTARRGAGTLDLSIRRKGDDTEAPGDFFQRRFVGTETKEVRVFLGDGRDSVLVSGTGGGPTLRVIGSEKRGKGDPKVVRDDAAGGTTKVYDTDPATVVGGSHRPSLDRRPYAAPDSTRARDGAPRDWGHLWRFNPWLFVAPDIGVFVGFGPSLYTFGFRQNPYASRISVRGGYATSADAFRVEAAGDFRFQNSGTFLSVNGRASGIDVLRFFGFGNESPSTAPTDDFYKVYQQQYSFAVGIAQPLARNLMLRVGPAVKYVTTDLARATFVSAVRPYGSANFGMFGGGATLELDTRDSRGGPTRGVHLVVGGAVYPSVWDVQSTFGEVSGEAATYLTARMPLHPTLALRAGGKKVWGAYPFFEAAFVGGAGTVRGLRSHRYIGDASAYGNAELRLDLGRYYIVLPGSWGLLGTADVGRVWLEGESSDTWHHAVGGGLWFAPLARANTLSTVIASGEGRTAFYLRAGFMF